jgi:hypothetical protein
LRQPAFFAAGQVVLCDQGHDLVAIVTPRSHLLRLRRKRKKSLAMRLLISWFALFEINAIFARSQKIGEPIVRRITDGGS